MIEWFKLLYRLPAFARELEAHIKLIKKVTEQYNREMKNLASTVSAFRHQEQSYRKVFTEIEDVRRHSREILGMLEVIHYDSGVISDYLVKQHKKNGKSKHD